MKTYHNIIIYGAGAGNGIATESELHEKAKSSNEKNARILYYGLAVRGKTRQGNDASQRMVAIVEFTARDGDDLYNQIGEMSGWGDLAKDIREDMANGKFDAPDSFSFNSRRDWKSVLTKSLGEKYGVACVYDFNDADKKTKIFTYGDKRKTVNTFNAELVGNVKAAFAKDLSGTGVPQEFSVDANTVKVKLTKDGKARLCFAVHMKSSKKDFADVALQTKINELRKEISFKYGVDIDIVDIRSTIEYV